jgi:hypothetical protein
MQGIRPIPDTIICFAAFEKGTARKEKRKTRKEKP